MIVANDCLILHIFKMSDGETREEAPRQYGISALKRRQSLLTLQATLHRCMNPLSSVDDYGNP